MTDENIATQGRGLSLALSEDGRKLQAHYAPVEEKTPIDLTWLRQLITDQGFDQLALDERALVQVVKQFTVSSDPFVVDIGEVRDAGVSVEVAPDKMTAWLSVTPPRGGAPVSAEQIRHALAEKQVTSGILESIIEQVVEKGEAQREIVAQGREVVHGLDGKLECLIELAKERHPHLDEHGIADYRDLGWVVTVHEGERLMQKTPPTLGEPGENVLGQVIPAKPGKDAMFAPQLKGAKIDPGDPGTLIAAISGQPVLVNNAVAVEPTIAFATIDLSIGNVNFDGTVNVTGDVHAGMTIRATGDIHIGGTVEAAVLEAGGNVVVKGGVIGHGEIHEHPDPSQKSMIAHVHCGGCFSAHFVENASIEAGDSIMVNELAMQSELAAANQILIGQPGSGRGRIIGGLTEATLLVQAAVIGSPAGVKTRVMVGTNPYLLEKIRLAAKQLEAKNHELDEVVKLLNFIEAHPERIKPEIRQKAENTFLALQQTIEIALQDKAELDKQVELSGEARIVVEKTIYSNVQIEIGGKIHHVEMERSQGTFKLGEDEIEFT